MRIVVDTNIVFSAILNTDSNIAQIILQPKTKLNFYSTEKLRLEINEHRDKILNLTDYSEQELNRMINFITNKIRFIQTDTETMNGQPPTNDQTACGGMNKIGALELLFIFGIG